MSRNRAPSHRVYQPGKRHMELIASVSRSSGLEKGGDALRDFKVQQEYREFIQSKVDEYWKRYPLRSTTYDVKAREEVQQNLLILFRKLREGILSTNRSDAFALEVYETSLHFAVIFHTPIQTSSVLSHLLPDLYLRVPAPASPTAHASTAQATTVLALLHHLVAAYPSQSQYRERLHSLPHAFLPRTSDAHRWLDELARNLRRCNYARLDALTHRSAFERIFRGTEDAQGTRDPGNLAFEALCTLADALRTKARETTWLVLRGAYRELSCPQLASPPTPVEYASPSTRMWLARSLMLRPALSKDKDTDVAIKAVDEWLARKAAEGDVRSRESEGMEGRWIVCKVPAKRRAPCVH
ncbi:hypothetical protein B0H21DRAFT_820610 [Amylocystis lapponica]|nr:hypothetical protein B0H21DRAFT_820610 [Amylocystis lapponica]